MSFGNRNAAHYKVPVKKLPKAANTETVESRYWKSFKVSEKKKKKKEKTKLMMMMMMLLMKSIPSRSQGRRR